MQQRVLVTVLREEGTDGGRDLELPAELPAAELTRLLGRVLDWPDHDGDLRMRLEPGGHVLEPGESLAAAGAANGAWLVLSAAAPPAAAAAPALASAWPTFLAARPAAAERRWPTLPLIGGGAAVLVLAIGGALLLRPAPAAPPVASSSPTLVPTPLPTAIPTFAPTAVPTPLPVAAAVPVVQATVAPTAVPTVPPPTALPSPTAPPRPTIAATTVAQDAASQWPLVLAQLAPVWGREWPRAIELAQGFLARYPGFAPATDKLYGALVEYGHDLKSAGRVDDARAAWQGADALLPQRGEARAEIEALAAPPEPRALEPLTTSAPSRPAPAAVRVVPAAAPPATEAVEEAPPPAKLNVTRDGFAPPENDR